MARAFGGARILPCRFLGEALFLEAASAAKANAVGGISRREIDQELGMPGRVSPDLRRIWSIRRSKTAGLAHAGSADFAFNPATLQPVIALAA